MVDIQRTTSPTIVPIRGLAGNLAHLSRIPLG